MTEATEATETPEATEADSETGQPTAAPVPEDPVTPSAIDPIVLDQVGSREILCVDTEGRTHEPLIVQVDQTEARVETTSGQSPRLVRGGEVEEVRIALESDHAVPEGLRIVVPEGVTVGEVHQEGATLVVPLTATESAPNPIPVHVVIGGEDDQVALADFEIPVEDPEPPPPPAPPPVEHRDPERPQEALALALHPEVLGLVNDRRIGSGGFLSIGHHGRLGEGDGYLRAVVGVEAAATADVRVGIAHAMDIDEAGVVPDQRGDRDIMVWAGYRAIADRELSLYVDLTAWLPTGGAGGIGSTRFAPSVSLSYLFAERWLARTRQGAILAADSDGPFAWASAYGLDVRLVGSFSVGIELDATFGKRDDAALTSLAAGLGLSLGTGPVVFGLGARFGLTDDFQDNVGRYGLSLSARVAFE